MTEQNFSTPNKPFKLPIVLDYDNEPEHTQISSKISSPDQEFASKKYLTETSLNDFDSDRAWRSDQNGLKISLKRKTLKTISSIINADTPGKRLRKEGNSSSSSEESECVDESGDEGVDESGNESGISGNVSDFSQIDEYQEFEDESIEKADDIHLTKRVQARLSYLEELAELENSGEIVTFHSIKKDFWAPRNDPDTCDSCQEAIDGTECTTGGEYYHPITDEIKYNVDMHDLFWRIYPSSVDYESLSGTEKTNCDETSEKGTGKAKSKTKGKKVSDPDRLSIDRNFKIELNYDKRDELTQKLTDWTNTGMPKNVQNWKGRKGSDFEVEGRKILL